MRSALLFFLFALVPIASRLGLQAGGYDSGPGGYLSDLLWAWLLAILLLRSSRWTIVLVFALWSIVYLGNLAFIQAMGDAVDYQDLGFLADPDFIVGTLGDRVWMYALATLAYLALTLVWLTWLEHKFPRPQRTAAMQIALLCLAAAVYVQFHWGALSHWANSSFASLLIADLEASLVGNDVYTLPPVLPPALDPPGEPVSSLGAARNVLLIVMEGLHGAYLPDMAKRNRVTTNAEMHATNDWMRRGFSVPDFLLHVRQTNRGLYAMLCGDTPRLDGGQPKSMQLLNAPDAARECLPNLLAERGFRTSYIQAADLQFMSKDLVMPAMGFQQVQGMEAFAELGKEVSTGFSWGPTDAAFFDQVLPKVRSLEQGDTPWFATLLTVGTHYPYGVSAAEVAALGNPRDAAVVAADRALGRFLDELESEGILEDTLVIVTADESHGLPGHWLGKNWGFLFALAPDLEAAQKSEVHSSLDIPNSILDYLGLFPDARTRQGRSIFRTHDTKRRLMFSASTQRMLDEDGLIHSCTRRVKRDGSNLDSECISLQSASGRLFDSDYNSLEGDYGSVYEDFWRDWQQSANRFFEQKEWRVLSAETEIVAAEDSNLALAHHRVSVPGQSLLTITFEAAYSGDDEDGARLEWLEYRPEMGSSMPGLLLPPLVDGDRVEVRYTLPYYGADTGLSFVLKLAEPLADGVISLRNYRLAVQAQEGGRKYLPRVHLETRSSRLAGQRFTHQLATDGPGQMQPTQPPSVRESIEVEDLYRRAAPFADRECAEREFSPVERRIIQAYLVYYSRPADPGGLAFWTQRVESYRYEGGARPAGEEAWLPPVDPRTRIDEAALKTIVTAFAASEEYTRYYAGLDTAELVSNLYLQLFNQAAPADRLKFYSDAVKAGTLSRDEIAMDIVRTAGPVELEVFSERLAVSRRYTTEAERLEERAVPAPMMANLIAGVDGVARNAEQACAVIHYLLESSPLVQAEVGGTNE